MQVGKKCSAGNMINMSEKRIGKIMIFHEKMLKKKLKFNKWRGLNKCLDKNFFQNY